VGTASAGNSGRTILGKLHGTTAVVVAADVSALAGNGNQNRIFLAKGIHGSQAGRGAPSVGSPPYIACGQAFRCREVLGFVDDHCMELLCVSVRWCWRSRKFARRDDTRRDEVIWTKMSSTSKDIVEIVEVEIVLYDHILREQRGTPVAFDLLDSPRRFIGQQSCQRVTE